MSPSFSNLSKADWKRFNSLRISLWDSAVPGPGRRKRALLASENLLLPRRGAGVEESS